MFIKNNPNLSEKLHLVKTLSCHIFVYIQKSPKGLGLMSEGKTPGQTENKCGQIRTEEQRLTEKIMGVEGTKRRKGLSKQKENTKNKQRAEN